MQTIHIDSSEVKRKVNELIAVSMVRVAFQVARICLFPFQEVRLIGLIDLYFLSCEYGNGVWMGIF